MIENILSGALLGLSTGLFCLASCAPVFIPFMISEDRTVWHNARIIGELGLGRLAAYLLIGAIVGVLTVQIDSPMLRQAAGVALILVSLLLLFFVLTQRSPRAGICRMFHSRVKMIPVLFGFLTGINVCPPFLLAISYATGVGSIAGSILVFLGFFLGTSLYLFLLIPLGWVGKNENFRLIGQIAAVLSGILFLVIGIVYLMT